MVLANTMTHPQGLVLTANLVRLTRLVRLFYGSFTMYGTRKFDDSHTLSGSRVRPWLMQYTWLSARSVIRAMEVVLTVGRGSHR